MERLVSALSVCFDGLFKASGLLSFFPPSNRGSEFRTLDIELNVNNIYYENVSSDKTNRTNDLKAVGRDMKKSLSEYESD